MAGFATNLIDPEQLLFFIILLVFLSLWEGIWKSIALWKSGRNNQLLWFIFILIFNTIGLLPIIYLFFFQSKKVKKKK